MIPSTRIPASAFAMAALIALLPAAAWANTITAMVGASAAYLYIGNLLLAFLEAGLLFALFKFPLLRSILVMLVANIASFLVGLFLLQVPVQAFNALFPEVPIIGAATAIVAAATMLAICTTLLVEYPFVWLSALGEKRGWRSAAIACVAVHAISIPITIAWFAAFTDLSMARHTVVRADAAEFAKPPIGTVYFVRGNALHSIRTDGTGEQRVSEKAPRRLDWRTMWWRIPVEEGDEPRFTRQIEAFLPGDDGADDWSAGPFHGHLPIMGGGGSTKFSEERGAEFTLGRRWVERHSFDREELGRVHHMSYNPLRGITAEGQRTGVTLDAPGLIGGRFARTNLPNGQMVFWLHGRIVLYDPATGEMAELAMGEEPIVLIREEDLEGFDGELPPTEYPEWLFGGINLHVFGDWLGQYGFGPPR